jgi:predicted nucleotidyltransferase
MKILFLDMEWGQVYGSYRRDFVPIEVGAVISGLEDSVPVLESRKFRHDINLVIRRNTINQIGKTIGFSEWVANIGRGEYQKPFDPSYRLEKTDKIAARKLSRKVLSELRQHLHSLFKKYQISQIVLFGGHEDLNLLRKANINTSDITIVDIQRIIQKEVRYLFSLDKISLIIGFYSSNKAFGSKNFRYPLPEHYKYLIKPHRAIGDACRIFVIYEEFFKVKLEFIQQCRNYLHVNHQVIVNTSAKSS